MRYIEIMAKGQRKAGSDKSAIVAALPKACADELAAVEFIESLRWSETGPCCLRCGDTDVYKMTDRKTGQRNKRFLWKCNGCQKQYTVRVGTVMEDSRIPLRHWAYALWKSCSSKKGVSALQIKRETGLTYKSALFMMHRIRFGMAEDWTGQPKLSGIVESDETYVGGKPRNKQLRPGPRIGWGKKTPVVSVVERGGNIRSFVTADVTAANVGRILAENVSRDSHLMTDKATIYMRGPVTKPFARHGFTDHSKGQYAKPDGTHSNTVESAFSLLKRGIYGTFHNVSRKHLHRYVAEFDFRWNARKVDDGERLARAIRSSEGKRLRYKEPVRTLPPTPIQGSPF
ncbi:MAG: IS1595 family transposase [Beijerinckiaceae bacterium]